MTSQHGEAFRLTLGEENPPVTVDPPYQGPVIGAYVFSLLLTCTNFKIESPVNSDTSSSSVMAWPSHGVIVTLRCLNVVLTYLKRHYYTMWQLASYLPLVRNAWRSCNHRACRSYQGNFQVLQRSSGWPKSRHSCQWPRCIGHDRTAGVRARDLANDRSRGRESPAGNIKYTVNSLI